MADNVELKATIKSDSTQAKADLEGFNSTVDKTGDELEETGKKGKVAGSELKDAGDKAKGAGLSLTNLASATRLVTGALSTAGRLMGDVWRQVEASIKRSAESGDKESLALVGSMEAIKDSFDKVVNLLTDSFAPAVAVVSKALSDWLTDFSKSESAIKGLKNASSDLIFILADVAHAFVDLSRLTYLVDLKYQAAGVADALGVASDAQLAYLRQVNLNVQEGYKLAQTLEAMGTKLRQQPESAAAVVTAMAALGQASLETGEAHEKHAEKITKVKTALEELRLSIIGYVEDVVGALGEAQEKSEETYQARLDNIQTLNVAEEELARLTREVLEQMAADETLSANTRMQAKMRLGAMDRKTTLDEAAEEKKRKDNRKKADDERIKAAMDTANKVGDVFKGLANDLLFNEVSLKDALTNIFKQLAQQLVATFIDMAVKSIAQAAIKAAGAKAFAGAESAAHASVVGPAIASWTAAIPFVGPAVYSAYFATFQGLIAASKGIGAGVAAAEEGGPVSGLVPGLGRQDRTQISAAADEGVLTGAGMNTTLGQVLGLVNKGLGGGNGTALAAATGGPQQLDVRVSFDVPGGSDDSFIRWVMERINVRVTQRNAPLVASRYHSQNGRSI